MDMDKEMNKLADQTAKMFDSVRETATASLESAKTKNKELKEDMVKKRDEKLKTTEDPHEKALLEKQAMYVNETHAKNPLRLHTYAIYCDFSRLKIGNFHMRNCDNFLNFAKNMDCGYTLLTSTHNLCFRAKIRK